LQAAGRRLPVGGGAASSPVLQLDGDLRQRGEALVIVDGRGELALVGSSSTTFYLSGGQSDTKVIMIFMASCCCLLILIQLSFNLSWWVCNAWTDQYG
jgi:hypothetical protein